MEFVDTRRLTGANFYAATPGAVATVRFGADEDDTAAVARWCAAIASASAALQWSTTTHVRTSVDAAGVREAALMLTAAVDRLYAAAEVAQWAVEVANDATADHDTALQRIAREAAEEQATRADAMTLIAAAEQHGVPWLLDDDILSVGWGRHGRAWALADVPTPASVDWTHLAAIPLALVTGTNGKTTTSRLLARMARLAGHHVGNSSTDGLCVDEVVVDAGDWTGPGAARALLRRPDVDLAVLEAARGGLLRRGIEVAADVAIVTNVEYDHMGEYGIHDLPAMAQAKGLVARAVRPGGCIVLGADSPAVVQWAQGRTLGAPVQWISADPDHPVLRAHVAAGGVVWTVCDAMFVRRDAAGDDPWLAVNDAPLTFGGKARHNVANALGAAAVGHALGLAREAIVAALRTFGAQPRDNPGRARAWKLADGRELLVDFAHNPAGLAAVTDLVGALGRRPIVCFGMAGDRSDDDLRALGAGLAACHPRHIVLCEKVGYLRGRTRGEVPALLAQGVRSTGHPDAAVHYTQDEPAALDLARQLAEPGELLLLLLNTERDAIEAWLRRAGGTPVLLQ